MSEKDVESVPQTLPPSRKIRFINALSLACAGSSLICDGYQNNVMTAVNLVLKKKYKKVYSTSYVSRVSNGMTVGQIIGMLIFGLTCDLFSRKNSIVFTTILMLAGSIIATAAHGATTHKMFWMIAIGQGICGVGVGGEFPTAAAMTAEATTADQSKSRGWKYILVTNIPLQFGGPLTMSIFLIVWEIAHKHLNTVWRVMFGIGCVWPVLVFILRIGLYDSELFHRRKFINYEIPWLLAFRFYWKRLLGTCFTFLLYDWIVKSNGTMSSLIINSVVHNGDTKKTAEWQLLLSAIQLLGIPLGALLCEPLGRKRVLLLGFLGFVVFGVAIGASWYHIKDKVALFVVLYGLFAATGHMGPGCMIGLISTESYATGVRASLYGLSSAFGRAGGAIGIEAFGPIANNMGQRWTFIFSAIIGAIAMIWAWLFIPDLSSEDLELEDLRFEKFQRMHGCTARIGRDCGTYSSKSSYTGDAEDAEDTEDTKDQITSNCITVNDMNSTLKPKDRGFLRRVFSMSPLD